jgi:MFS family permease
MSASGRQRYLMLFIAFMASNVALGLTFASVGLLIEPLSEELQGSRSLLSLSIAFLILAGGVTGPLVGMLVDRWSLRGTMLIGCLLGAAGFYGAAQATSTFAYLLSFGLVLGLGYALMGILPANKLVALWFPHQLGRASGIANLLVLSAIGPPLFAYVIATSGWRDLLEGFALVYLGLFLLVWLVRVPTAAGAATQPAGQPKTAPPPAQKLPPPYKKGVFWVLCGGMGLLYTNGIVATTHMVAYAIGEGIPGTQASMLLSILGVCSALGAVCYGWLCDRYGAFAALMLNATIQTSLWVLVLNAPGFTPLAVAMGGFGLCGGGALPIVNSVLSRAYPARQFGSAFGLVGLVTLPFSFGAAPVSGLLYDLSGHYRGAFMLEAALGIVALLVLWLGRAHLRKASNT